MRIRSVLGLCALLTACGSSPGSPAHDGAAGTGGLAGTCVPGAQSACTCDGGRPGVSVCTEVGSPGPCSCAPPQGSGAPLAGAASVGGAGAPSLPGGGAGTTAAGAGGGDAIAGAGGSHAIAGAPGMPPAVPLAAGVRIRELALFQPTKVTLVRDGEEVLARNAPVVVGKQALLRVFVETLPGFAPRELVAELELASSEAAVSPQSVTARITDSSTDAELGSTLNFELPATVLVSDLRYAVSLREVPGVTPSGTADEAARFPVEPDALSALGPRNAGPLRVRVVPYRYTADGSGRSVDVSPERMQNVRDVLAVYYPTSEIVLEVHDPVDYPSAVTPNGGWEQWLDYHCALRGDEAPDPKVLYYGMIMPADSARQYGSGVYGISPVPSPAGNYGRCSVGVGFDGSGESTMAHELGHSLGLPHAPCGLSDAGPFPYPEAKIGVWGYGFVSRTLKDPDEMHDLMSYCDPSFISDFNFERLFERIRYLNLQFDERPGEATRYARVLVGGDGRAELRGTVSLPRAPGGPDEARAVELLDGAGRSLGMASGFRFPFSERGASLWLVPEGERGATSARIDGAGMVPLTGGTP